MNTLLTILTATTGAAGEQPQGMNFSFIIMIVAMMAVFYFFIS